MSEILVVKDKVGRYIKEVFDQVNIGDNGEFVIPYESTLVVVRLAEIQDPEVVKFKKELGLPLIVVHFFALVLMDVRPSNDLYKWIATEGQTFDFGTFKFDLSEDGKTGTVVFDYMIAGDTADPEEVKNAIIAVATVADNMDDELKKMFGGRLFQQG